MPYAISINWRPIEAKSCSTTAGELVGLAEGLPVEDLWRSRGSEVFFNFGILRFLAFLCQSFDWIIYDGDDG